MLWAIGQALRETGEISEALNSFEQGAALAEQSCGPAAALILRNQQAFLLNETGARRAAESLCLERIAAHSDREGRPGLLAGIPMLAYGCFLYESGRAAEASAALTQAVDLVTRLGLHDLVCGPGSQARQYLLSDQG
jgi:hypothetical protein